jgi:segregation and condensation protein B
MDELVRTLEALLFLSSEPRGADELAEATGESPAEVREALVELGQRCAPGMRGVVLREVGGGFTLASDPAADEAARRLFSKPRDAPLTPAQAEALAIVAYLQPVSRPEMARIRGVSSDSAAASLLERGLIEEAGRSPFGAVLYRTSDLFLKLFGLNAVGELPEITEWDPSPEEEAALRDRLLRAGEARAGVGAVAEPA